MKTLRRISALTLLSLTLSICVLAGQIETPGRTETDPPPPPPANTTTQITGITTDVVLAVLVLIYP